MQNIIKGLLFGGANIAALSSFLGIYAYNSKKNLRSKKPKQVTYKAMKCEALVRYYDNKNAKEKDNFRI